MKTLDGKKGAPKLSKYLTADAVIADAETGSFTFIIYITHKAQALGRIQIQRWCAFARDATTKFIRCLMR